MTSRTKILICSGLFVARGALAFAQTVNLAPVGTIAGPADLIEVSGRYA